MKNLLRSYLFRLFKEPQFYMFLAFSVGFGLLWASLSLYGHYGTPTGSTVLGSHLSLLWSIPFLLGPIYSFVFFSREWDDLTIRNMIFAGKSRLKIYVSSIVLGLLISYIFLLASLLFFYFLVGVGQVPFTNPDIPLETFFVGWAMLFALETLCSIIAVSLVFLFSSSFAALGVSIAMLLISYLLSVLIPVFLDPSSSLYLDIKEWLFIDQMGYFSNLYSKVFSWSTCYQYIWKSLLTSGVSTFLIVFFSYRHFRSRDLE